MIIRMITIEHFLGVDNELEIPVPVEWVKWTLSEQEAYVENFIEELDDGLAWDYNEDPDDEEFL